jgi:uroporphyrinogen decarboxylase
VKSEEILSNSSESGSVTGASPSSSFPHHLSMKGALRKAVRCLPTENVPVWLMRQAGRYMSEYQQVRAKVSFLDLCKTPELAAEVMITAVNKINADAAILFSDILLILEPLGFEIAFPDTGGPQILNPIKDANDVQRVRELQSVEPLQYVMDAVKCTRENLDESKPLIGFSGAPFTLASYVIEHNASGYHKFNTVKAFMHLYPAEWDLLMTKLAVSAARYLNGQIRAGAEIIQIFDSWAGCVSQEDYRKYVFPYSKMLIDLVVPGAPVIHFAPGNPMLLPLVSEAGGNVIGADWRVSIRQAWDLAGKHRAIQGNLDPAILLTDKDTIRRHVLHILRLVERQPGFIFNLGHGVLPQTPVENVIALIDMVHELGRVI